jgi:hypothetical protein
MFTHNISPGDKISLIKLYDTYLQLPPGTTGTVSFIDSVGTIHVKWDNGIKLGLLPGIDKYELV